MWRSKGLEKNKLLGLFVSQCYKRSDDNQQNRCRLEALIKFRQVSKEFKEQMMGYEWLSPTEMKEKGWSDAKIEGAKQVCQQRKLTKKCLYEKGVLKYLVLTSDTVKKLS